MVGGTIAAIGAIGGAVGTAGAAVGTAAGAAGITGAGLATTASLGYSAYSAYDSYSAGKSAASAQGAVESYNRINSQFNLTSEGHNASIDEMFQVANIRQQQEVASRQHEIALNSAAWAEYEASVNRKVVDAVADAQIRALRLEARGIESRGREATSRSREQGERIGATQRARTAKAGAVVGTGTPLDVAIETAGNIELAIQDQKYGSDLESIALRNQAVQVDYERDFTLQLDKVASDYGISKMLALSQFERDVSQQQGRIDTLGAQTQRKLRDIDIANRMWGVENTPSKVPAMKAQNTANLISNVGSTVGSAYSALNTAGVFDKKPYASVRPAAGYTGANT
tara:strand:+ start:15109 stop:16134 length:1026 start_codon:yes stop_codon:yes gene_type:complete